MVLCIRRTYLIPILVKCQSDNISVVITNMEDPLSYLQGPIRQVELSCLPALPQYGIWDLSSTTMLGWWWLSESRVGLPWMPLHHLMYYKYLWESNQNNLLLRKISLNFACITCTLPHFVNFASSTGIYQDAMRGLPGHWKHKKLSMLCTNIF